MPSYWPDSENSYIIRDIKNKGYFSDGGGWKSSNKTLVDVLAKMVKYSRDFDIVPNRNILSSSNDRILDTIHGLLPGQKYSSIVDGLKAIKWHKQ